MSERSNDGQPTNDEAIKHRETVEEREGQLVDPGGDQIDVPLDAVVSPVEGLHGEQSKDLYFDTTGGHVAAPLESQDDMDREVANQRSLDIEAWIAREKPSRYLARIGILEYLREVRGKREEGVIDATEIAKRKKISAQDVQISVGSLLDKGILVTDRRFRLHLNPNYDRDQVATG